MISVQEWVWGWALFPDFHPFVFPTKMARFPMSGFFRVSLQNSFWILQAHSGAWSGRRGTIIPGSGRRDRSAISAGL